MKLLIAEPPLQVLPTLATRIGLNEALVLQQLHWLGLYSKDDRWVARTIDGWNAQFPFWSIPTLKRTFASLRESELVERRQPGGTDRTVHYRLALEKVERLCNASDQIDPIEGITPVSTGSDRPVPSDQIDPIPIEEREELQESTPPNPLASEGDSVKWAEVLEDLRSSVPSTTWHWLENLRLVERRGEVLVLQAPDKQATWIRDRHLPLVEGAAARAFGPAAVVELPESETEAMRRELDERAEQRRAQRKPRRRSA